MCAGAPATIISLCFADPFNPFLIDCINFFRRFECADEFSFLAGIKTKNRFHDTDVVQLLDCYNI